MQVFVVFLYIICLTIFYKFYIGVFHMNEQTMPLAIRIPITLKKELEGISKREIRSLNNLIVKILSDYAKNYSLSANG